MQKLQMPIQANATLNPRLWSRGQLLPQVRRHLLAIAKEFEQTAKLPIQPVDLVITGAQAGFAWTKHSDLDLHWVVDWDTAECAELAQQLSDVSRILFAQQRSITVRSIPVEPGVESLRSPARGAAYSIITNQWLRLPQPVPQAVTDTAELTKLCRPWIVLARRAHSNARTLEAVLKLLKLYRKQGLATEQAEFSWPNLVYKSLRNTGLIKQWQSQIWRLRDRELTLKQENLR